MHSSIYDVAKRAGVSKSTVSRVLVDDRRVLPATRKRIEAAMRELNYRPNRLARGLVRGRTRTLGLVVFDLHNPYFGLLAEGAEAAAHARGYRVLVTISGASFAQQQERIAALAEHRVDGILVMPASTREDDVAAFRAAGLPLVLLDALDTEAAVPSITVDNMHGGRLATQHLLQLGHRRVAFVGLVPSMPASSRRLRGYTQAHSEAGLAIDPSLVVENITGLGDVWRAVRGLFERADPPTAIFAVNDEVALVTLQALTAGGRRVPDDVGLVGYDDIPVAGYLSTPLTTVAQPKEEFGRLAANLLIDHIEHPQLAAHQIAMQPHLVVRGSCGARAGAGDGNGGQAQAHDQPPRWEHEDDALSELSLPA